jgi:hypothetical protein
MGQTNDTKSRRQSGKSRQTKAPRFDRSRFIQYELDVAEQAECKGWDVSPSDQWSEVSALVDSGYTVSLKFDTFSEAYACFIRGGDKDGDPNSGLILSGRGSTPAKAFKQACFKNAKIGPDWSEFAEKRTAVLDD